MKDRDASKRLLERRTQAQATAGWLFARNFTPDSETADVLEMAHEHETRERAECVWLAGFAPTLGDRLANRLTCLKWMISDALDRLSAEVRPRF